jgi:hypothetical protein
MEPEELQRAATMSAAADRGARRHDATGRKGDNGEVQEDRGLTTSATVRSVTTGDAGRRRIDGGERRPWSGKTRTAASIKGTTA